MPQEVSLSPFVAEANRAGLTRRQTLAQPAAEQKGTEKPEGGKVLPPEEPRPVQKEEVSNAVESLNQYMKSIGRNLRFSIDADSGYTVITVVDRETEEVIRQIPSEEVLERLRDQQEAGISIFTDRA